MDPQQTPPQNPNDIDARIMAERHAAEAYTNKQATTGLPQNTQGLGSLSRTLQKRAAVLAAIPLVFLVSIIAIASRGGSGNNNAHKSDIAITDDSQSADGSLTADYVVAEDEKDAAITGPNKIATSSSSSESTNQNTTKNSNSTTQTKPPKTTKPNPIKKPPKPPKPPIVIGTPPQQPQPTITLVSRKTFAATSYVFVTDSTIKKLPGGETASSTIYKKNQTINVVELRAYSNGRSFYLVKSQVDAGAKTGFLATSLKKYVVPASIIDLKPWKLTLPVNSSGGLGGSAAEIIGKDLTKYTKSPWYIPVKDSAGKLVKVVFYATDRGATTSKSGNPRSELREMKRSDPKKENNWSPYSGTHRMLVRQKVTALTGRQAVVIGQIHDKDNDDIDDYTVFRLEGTKLYAYIDGTKDKSTLIGTVKLGQIITVGFSVENGKIRMYYSPNGTMSALKLVKIVTYPSGSKGGAYFKAGSYCQCGVGKGYTGSSRVEILGLGVNHNVSGWPNIGGK